MTPRAAWSVLLALREPTRPGPACCRPLAIEGPAAPDGKAPCVGSRRSVGRHPPTPSAPALRRRPTSAGGLLSASSGRNGRRERGMAARSCAPDASAKIQVLSPVKWGRSRRGRDLWDTAAAQRRRETHRARAPLSASLGTFSAWRNHLARRRNIDTHPPPNFGIGGFTPYAPHPLRGKAGACIVGSAPYGPAPFGGREMGLRSPCPSKGWRVGLDRSPQAKTR